jgi:hypothetical protein
VDLVGPRDARTARRPESDQEAERTVFARHVTALAVARRLTSMRRLLQLFVGCVVGSACLAAPASAHHVGDLDCGDFSSQAAAQYHVNAHPGDPDGLDGDDNDGRACESNPCPCYYGPDTGPPPPPPADTDGDGVPDLSDGCPTIAAATSNGCPPPPPPDTDGDGLSDDVDDCPTVAATTDNGCLPPPPPPPTYVGAIGKLGESLARWTDRLQKPRRLVPCSGDGNCQVVQTWWRNWGRAVATGRGTAKVNDCRPTCALGRFRERRGARLRAYRRRDGSCDGQAVRYYTRVRVQWPDRLRMRTHTMKLAPACASDA